MNINRNCVLSSSAELGLGEGEPGAAGGEESAALHQGNSSRVDSGSRSTGRGHRLSALSVLSCLTAFLHQVGRSEGSNSTDSTGIISSNSTATNGTSDVEGGATMSAPEIAVVVMIVLVVTVALSVVIAICCHNTGSDEEGEPEPHRLSVIMEVEGGSGSDGNAQVVDLGGSASDSSGGSGTELQSTAL